MTDSGKPWWQRMLLRIGIGLVSVIAVAGYSAWHLHRNANQQLDKYAVGDCLVLSKKGLGVEDAKASCSQDPSYTAASRIGANDSCPNDNYSTFEVTAQGNTVGKLCLIENLVVGHCYESEMLSNVTKLVDCNRSSATSHTFKVVDRQETGTAACRPGLETVAYLEPSPGRTYCTTTTL